jgi:hypothetical protein
MQREAEANSVVGSQGRQGLASEPAQSDAGQAQLAKVQDDTKHGTQGITLIFDYDDTVKWKQRYRHGPRRPPVCVQSTGDARTEV